MLLREADDEVLAIGQVAHSMVAGRLAAAWAARPPALNPGWPELCLAAAIHDLGWGAWDAAPRLDPATGRPYSFRSIPDDEWAAVWARAPELAMPYGRVVELWVLRHAARLMRSERTAEIGRTRNAISDRLADLEHAVADDPALALDVAALREGTALLAAWDGLSLALCHGVTKPRDVDGRRLSPAGSPDGPGGPAGREVERVALDPWPLSVDSLTVVVDVRRLGAPAAAQPELDASWAAAEPETLTIALLPAAGAIATTSA